VLSSQQYANQTTAGATRRGTLPLPAIPSLRHRTLPPMPTTYPFHVTDLAEQAERGRQERILVNLSKLEEYYTVFEKYGFSGSGASWAEHIETILEEHAPALLDHIELAGQGDIFLAFTDGPAATEQFLALVQPIFGDLGSLSNYLLQADPDDFFE
jgi:Immunity protein 51